MDAKVWAICGVAAGFLMCVAAFAGSLDMARTRMTSVAKSPICRPDQAPTAKTAAAPSARQARGP